MRRAPADKFPDGQFGKAKTGIEMYDITLGGLRRCWSVGPDRVKLSFLCKRSPTERGCIMSRVSLSLPRRMRNKSSEMPGPLAGTCQLFSVKSISSWTPNSNPTSASGLNINAETSKRTAKDFPSSLIKPYTAGTMLKAIRLILDGR